MLGLIALAMAFLVDCVDVILIRVDFTGIKGGLIVILTVAEREVILKDFDEVLVVDFLQTRATENGQELHELGQLVVKLGQTIVLPHFLNLVEAQETVTIFVLQVEVVQEF